MNAKEEILSLRKTLEEHNYNYYVLDRPLVSDFDYDRLYRKLQELEEENPELITPDSPTQRVGGKALSSFQQVVHEVPLESLNDVFSFEEVRAFDAKTGCPYRRRTTSWSRKSTASPWPSPMKTAFLSAAPREGTALSGRMSQKISAPSGLFP
jgi:NAD-dependent DNA ligase